MLFWGRGYLARAFALSSTSVEIGVFFPKIYRWHTQRMGEGHTHTHNAHDTALSTILTPGIKVCKIRHAKEKGKT